MQSSFTVGATTVVAESDHLGSSQQWVNGATQSLYIAIQGNAFNEILYPNTAAAYSDLVAQTQSGMDAYLRGMVGQTGSGGLGPAGQDVGPLYFTITSAEGADVDEPGSVTILACGLLALAGVRRYLARGTGWRDAAALSTGEAMI